MTAAREARASVELAIERFTAARERERLVLYRMHLQATVRWISPLTLAMAKHVGIDLGDGMKSIRPPSEWPWRRPDSLVRSFAHRGHITHRLYFAPNRPAIQVLLQRYVTGHGFVHIGSGSDILVFDVNGPWLSMHGQIGQCALRVATGTAALTLPAGVPDTLAAAMVGKPVDAIVAHPALTGSGYSVKRVREANGAAGPTLIFSTGRSRLVMPWPELLRSGLSGGHVGERVSVAQADRPVCAAAAASQRLSELGL
ncbi:MAG: hypothetical protein M3Y41_17395 [Pseudomonadota bacterium]|nr:hypothetical protein [Pseudomonadota bacterium]